MINRREFSKAASAMALSLVGVDIAASEPKVSTRTKRVIFFLQNQGFEPKTCIETGFKNGGSLKSVKFSPPMKALEPYKERMNVIFGMHGRHTSPSHSACFGALGGYRGGLGVAPSAPTIDHVISQSLPPTVIPHLCIGMDSLDRMQTKPTIATLSAAGAGKPIYMHSHPEHLYQTIFGSVSEGDLNKRYNVQTSLLREIEVSIKQKASSIKGFSEGLFNNYSSGIRSLNQMKEGLKAVSGTLRKFKPKFDEVYTNPGFETEWHDRLLNIGIAALQANITNVLTIGSGRGTVDGSWKGLGVAKQGHFLGHMKQAGDEIWTKIRNYNCEMLVKIIKALEAIPEGNGNMMDNTLIVYTSNNGESQHTNGTNWPFVLIGNGGGAFKTGQMLKMNRPLNDLYTTFLHGIGKPVERFNISNKLAIQHGSKSGPIKELLA